MNTPTPPPLTPEEQRKVNRSLVILYLAMALMTGSLFLVLWLNNRGR